MRDLVFWSLVIVAAAATGVAVVIFGLSALFLMVMAGLSLYALSGRE